MLGGWTMQIQPYPAPPFSPPKAHHHMAGEAWGHAEGQEPQGRAQRGHPAWSLTGQPQHVPAAQHPERV